MLMESMGVLKIVNLVLFVLLFSTSVYAQKGHDYETVYDIAATEVKDQGNTGTCWAFSTTSFIESEILRMGGPKLDISEMFTVYNAYMNKARKYVYLHGKGNFAQGGLAHDVLNMIDKYGFVPEKDFYGRPDTTYSHNHDELEMALHVILNNYISQTNASPSSVWYSNIFVILKNYLGELPSEIQYNKRTYTPVDFAKGLGFNRDNYIEITSYTHHPFYEKFELEIPDNWSDGQFYNVPLDEMISMMKDALSKGFSFVWDGDTSNDFYSASKALAMIPEDINKGFNSKTEMVVSQEDRQKAFESWKVTDDHLMHVVGLVKDKDGKEYFKVKNSYGAKSNDDGGYLYMSMEYARMNTVSIMLNVNALNKEQSAKIRNN